MDRCTDILMMGKTGNGKSSTGNSILGRRTFKSLADSTSVTKEIQIEYSEVDGRILKVVDGPGVCDTDLNQHDSLQIVVECVKKAIAANPRGYHAILLVVRFSGRFTKEDNQAVQLLKGIFGDDFIRNFAILIVTHGDLFDPEHCGVGTFREWCRQQEGVFRDLLRECRDRVILFDNRTKNAQKQQSQREQLLRMVDALSLTGQRYCNEHFKRAEAERTRLIAEARAPMIREETLMEGSLIIQQISTSLLSDPEERLEKLFLLKERTEQLIASIIQQDRRSGSLAEIQKTAQHISETIDGHLIKTQEEIDIRRSQEQSRQEVARLRDETRAHDPSQSNGALQQAEARITELEWEINQREEKYERLVNSLRNDSSVVENEYQAAAFNQTQGLIPVIIEVLTSVLPLAIKIIFRR